MNNFWNRRFWILLLVILVISCKEEEVEQTLLEKLRALPGVTVTELNAANGFDNGYRIIVTQPLDHNNPAGATFTQEVILRHKDSTYPVVFDTKGYGLSENSKSSLNDLFPSNYVGVEHRYFSDSRPDPLDWQYLTIEQAATDHHKIYDLLDELYPGKWVSTGASKGGMTAIFHKRFFPNDVSATVAFVAPIMTGLPDTRFDEFLSSQVGTQDCRDDIMNFQREVLLRKESLLPLLQEHAQEIGFTYEMGFEKVLELMALEYQFSFWQYGGASCGSVPDSNSSDNDLFAHLLSVSPSWYYDNFYIDFFYPFFYQAYTQLGYYYFIDDHVEDLITALDAPNHLEMAPDVSMTYDPTAMQDILNWLSTEGDNIIYIYGADDPYTATAVPEPSGTNSLRIIQQGSNHNVKLDDLNNKEMVYSLLEEWLDVII